MNAENNHDSAEPPNTAPTDASADQKMEDLPDRGVAENAPSTVADAESSESDLTSECPIEASHEEDKAAALPEAELPKAADPVVLAQVEEPKAADAVEQQTALQETPSPRTADDSQSSEPTPPTVEEPASVRKVNHFFQERPPQAIEVAPHVLRHWTRRDVLIFGAGAIAALAGGGSLLPQATLQRLGVIHKSENWSRKEWLLNRTLRIDDDVAEALFSPNRLVPTYTKSQITPLRNNYNGATPDPSYIPYWHLTLDGLASGRSVSLNIHNLLTRFQTHEQITRLVCVEGWSAIAWWSGLRFDDPLRAYPPVSQAKWARVDSSVNLDPWGNPDPYFVSLDIPTARQPQTLLATHYNGQLLTVGHGAPLRLLVPVKLGLKNVKAVTRITYMAKEPKDYWAERGYSRYDGI